MAEDTSQSLNVIAEAPNLAHPGSIFEVMPFASSKGKEHHKHADNAHNDLLGDLLLGETFAKEMEEKQVELSKFLALIKEIKDKFTTNDRTFPRLFACVEVLSQQVEELSSLIQHETRKIKAAVKVQDRAKKLSSYVSGDDQKNYSSEQLERFEEVLEKSKKSSPLHEPSNNLTSSLLPDFDDGSKAKQSAAATEPATPRSDTPFGTDLDFGLPIPVRTAGHTQYGLSIDSSTNRTTNTKENRDAVKKDQNKAESSKSQETKQHTRGSLNSSSYAPEHQIISLQSEGSTTSHETSMHSFHLGGWCYTQSPSITRAGNMIDSPVLVQLRSSCDKQADLGQRGAIRESQSEVALNVISPVTTSLQHISRGRLNHPKASGLTRMIPVGQEEKNEFMMDNRRGAIMPEAILFPDEDPLPAVQTLGRNPSANLNPSASVFEPGTSRQPGVLTASTNLQRSLGISEQPVLGSTDFERNNKFPDNLNARQLNDDLHDTSTKNTTQSAKAIESTRKFINHDLSGFEDVVNWKVPAGFTGLDEKEVHNRRNSDAALFYEEGIRFQPGPQCRNAFRTVTVSGIPVGATFRDVTTAIKGGEIQDIQLVNLSGIMSVCGQHRVEWHDRTMVARVVFLHENGAIAFHDYSQKTGAYVNGERVFVKIVPTPTWPLNEKLEVLVYEQAATRILFIQGIGGKHLMELLSTEKGKLVNVTDCTEDYGDDGEGEERWEVECVGIVAAARLMETLQGKAVEASYAPDPCAK